MRCYCSEISALQKNIDTLYEIKGYMSTLLTEDSTLSSSLSKLSAVTGSTIEPSNISEIKDSILNLNQNTSGIITNIDGTCTSVINTLTEDKAYYTKLDDEYHAYIAEQERLRREQELKDNEDAYIY